MSRTKQEILIQKGKSLFNEGNYKGAIKFFQKSLEKSDSFDALAFYYLAQIIMKITVDYAQASNFLLKAIDSLDNENNKIAKSLKGACYMSLGYMYLQVGINKEAATYYYKSYLHCEDASDKRDAFSAYLMTIVSDNTPPHELLDELRKYDGIAYLCNKKGLPKKIRKRNYKDNKIHIAYISPDFRNHVMYDYYCALLKEYDKEKFFVSCISLTDTKDKYTEEIASLVDEFIDAGKTNFRNLAKKIKEYNFDILIDLAGHSAHSGLSLLGYRLAPVQISGLGWMETTGFKYVDYLITDRYLDPVNHTYITEKPLYLSSQFCYNPKGDFLLSEGAPCKKNNYITFGIFNRITKFTGEMVALWLEIMNAVPNSKLLIKCFILKNPLALHFLTKRMQKAGFDMNRIIFEEATSNYMERYLDVDIALDTYPYTGGGTTFDALYMGVPVVSLYGERRSSRFGLSILTNAGVSELAVPTPEEYAERAVALANDWELLDILHKNLRTMLEKSPAMDAKRYVREMELQYEKIFHISHETKCRL